MKKDSKLEFELCNRWIDILQKELKSREEAEKNIPETDALSKFEH